MGSIIKGTEGALYIGQAAALTAFTGEATTESAYIYQINNTAKRVWDPNTTVTLSTGSLNIVWMDGGIDYFSGRVKLNETGKTLTVTGAYLSWLSTIGCIFNWSLNLGRSVGDITSIGDLWKRKMALAGEATLTMERYRFDAYFATLVGNFDWVLVKLYEDATTGFWLKALIGQLGSNKAVGEVDTEPLTFSVSGPVGTI